MQFREIMDNLGSTNKVHVNKALGFLYKKNRSNIQYHLRKSGCLDTETFLGVFHDALFELLQTVRNTTFKGERMESFGAFLKQTSFFIWTKHSDNPRREEIKRGKKPKQLDESNVFGLQATSIQSTPKNIEELTTNDNLKIAVPSEHSNNKASGERLSDKIKILLKKLSLDCQERISRSMFFNPQHLFPSEKETPLKVSHQETAIDLQDKNEKASRKKLGVCKNHLKSIIDTALETDLELANLIDDILWN